MNRLYKYFEIKFFHLFGYMNKNRNPIYLQRFSFYNWTILLSDRERIVAIKLWTFITYAKKYGVNMWVCISHQVNKDSSTLNCVSGNLSSTPTSKYLHTFLDIFCDKPTRQWVIEIDKFSVIVECKLRIVD